MKSRNLPLMLAAVLAVSLAATVPGFSANDQGEPTTRKVTRHKRAAVPQSPSYTARPLNSCDYDRAAGRCVIDLGYGRCMECNGGTVR